MEDQVIVMDHPHELMGTPGQFLTFSREAMIRKLRSILEAFSSSSFLLRRCSEMKYLFSHHVSDFLIHKLGCTWTSDLQG